jgi:NTP pyrophosphatase (non-canonical NTP hydrolase)
MTTITLAALREANIARDKEWNTGTERVPLSFRGNELAGEAGEACNIIKKLERVRLGIKGSVSTTEALAEELADVVICADLTAMECQINLAEAIEAKFNAKSEEIGLKTKLSALSHIEAAMAMLEAHGYVVSSAKRDLNEQIEEAIALLESEGYRIVPPGRDKPLHSFDATRAREALDDIEKKIIQMAAVAKARQKIDPPEGSFASVIPALIKGLTVYRESNPIERYGISNRECMLMKCSKHSPWGECHLTRDMLTATDWIVVD